MVEKEVDLFGWSETNIEWNNYPLQHQCYKMIHRHLPGGAWKPTTSKIPMASNQKHGGNLMATNKKIRARTQRLEKDRMGRWVWTLIQGKQRPILIVQLYVPASTQGLMSTYAQQYQQLQEETGKAKPEVYTHYFKDLNSILEKNPTANKIIMGDFNCTTEDDEVAFLQSTYNLRDIYAEQHSENIHTHQRGSQRIDYMLISSELTPYVQHNKYEEFNQGITSDHRGLYMDLHMDVFKQRGDLYIRCLKANHGTKVKKYRKN